MAKIQFIIWFLFLPLEWLGAQSKFCDELVQVGDTFICRDFVGKSIAPAREHFYLYGHMIFTRRWYYWDNGEYSWVQFRKRGTYAKREGPACSFYADGTMMSYQVYKKGKLIGPCRNYYSNGTLSSTCERHIKGKLDGIQLKFHKNGLVKSKTRWKNGKLLQILRYKDPQGNDLPIGTFKDGNGTWVYYDEEGKQIGVQVYKNGALIEGHYGCGD